MIDPVGGARWADSGPALDFLARFSGRGRIESHPAETVLAGSSAESWFFGLVVSGSLLTEVWTADGRRRVTDFSVPGDLVGDVVPPGPSLSVIAGSDVRIYRVDRPDFDHVSDRHGDFNRVLYLLRLRRLLRLRWLCWTVSRFGVEDRLAVFLAQATTFMGWHTADDGSGVLELELSRTNLADLLATSVESISRATHGLADRGLIRILDPATFAIPSLERLQAIEGDARGAEFKARCA